VDQSVSVVSIVRERPREAPQPGGILEQLLRTQRSGHAHILSRPARSLPRICLLDGAGAELGRVDGDGTKLAALIDKTH
jgi:hypothetical protein